MFFSEVLELTLYHLIYNIITILLGQRLTVTDFYFVKMQVISVQWNK